MGNDIRDELDRITITTQADLQRLWELVIRPLGFSRRSLWVLWIDQDRRPVRQVVEVTEGDEVPDEEMIEGLFSMLEDVADDLAPGGSVAFLLSRPGHGMPQREDVRWAQALLEGSRRYDVPLQPMHVATDSRILPITPDDMAA